MLRFCSKNVPTKKITLMMIIFFVAGVSCENIV
jgi:hypothetical protein